MEFYRVQTPEIFNIRGTSLYDHLVHEYASHYITCEKWVKWAHKGIQKRYKIGNSETNKILLSAAQKTMGYFLEEAKNILSF